MSNSNEKPWKITKSEPGPDLIIFKSRFDWVYNPRTTHKMKVAVLESPDWANIVAVTPDQKIVVVHQYRFGVGKTTTEIPAGIIEPGENPQQAAIRELQEETGYTSQNWLLLGKVEANPAFLNNHCYLWMATDVIKTQPTNWDRGEEIGVSEYSLEEVHQAIESGRMINALALLALSRVFDFRVNAK